MSTPDYYEYMDSGTYFECFDISRYYSGDWAQVIQYVFRWQKKGGIEDLKKALACAEDAYANNMPPDLVDDGDISQILVENRLRTLKKHNFSNATKVWESFIETDNRVDKIVDALEEMIKDAENETI